MSPSDFPPRGSGILGREEAGPSAQWVDPTNLGPNWNWAPGKWLLGRWGGRLLGMADDRHGILLAGTRAGKSSTVLTQNLLSYPGSVVVIDPKGELTDATFEARWAMGQQCFTFDPFGETRFASASYNPFSELGYGRAEHVAADAALAADALITPNDRDPHWTDSARNLIRGLTLHLMLRSGNATLRDIRRLLNQPVYELKSIFEEMGRTDAFNGVVANIGHSFLGKAVEGTKELTSILSTAQEQTSPLDDIVAVTDRSDFSLSDLGKGNTTLSLVLPGIRMGTHSRVMRIVIQQALAALERHPVKRGGLPVLFILEEFNTLGYLRSLETAAGLLAGSGVKLWSVLQDLTQLKTHYPKSWETFLGSAGVIQAFANSDLTTTEYLSKLLGMTQVIERQDIRLSGSAMGQGDNGRREHLRSVRLLEPDEITRHFARETNRQLVLVPGRRPIFMERMGRNETV